MDQSEDKIRDLLNRQAKRDGTDVISQVCPDDESLASYVSGFLAQEMTLAIETHLAECQHCLHVLATISEAVRNEAEVPVPQRVMHRAMALVQARPGKEIFDLVVRMAKDTLELVSTSAQMLPTLVPAGVRGKARPDAGSILSVERAVGELNVTVEVELIEPRLCQISVGVRGRDGKPVDNLRLSLIRQKRELASYLTRQGGAVFDRISRGEYELAVSQSGTPLGSMRLNLTD